MNNSIYLRQTHQLQIRFYMFVCFCDEIHAGRSSTPAYSDFLALKTQLQQRSEDQGCLCFEFSDVPLQTCGS